VRKKDSNLTVAVVEEQLKWFCKSFIGQINLQAVLGGNLQFDEMEV
jgi:hypothetical protein